MDSAIPSDAELQSAEFALSALRKAVAEGEEAATRQPTADVERPAEPSVASPGPAWSLQEASKLSKKKTAIFLAYDGSGFSGMQINPGVPTIEKSLRDALVLAGGISKNNENKFSVLKWCRSARTDKGVSALGQVVALRLMHADGLLQRLQSHLPRKIKVLGLRRVTASFDARSQCDSRLYEYILPEWVFDPDLKLISTKEGPQEEPADAPAAPPGHFGELNVEKAAGVPSENGGVHHRKARSRIGPPIASNRSFTFEEGCCARLTGILKQFEGTHNFHNFSPNVCPEQMSAQRNILSFKCLGTFSISNGCSEERWVRMHVHGQSFLMNQIRKMVGLAVAVYRGVAPPEAVHWALDPTRDFSTPMAPELGLFLYESKFDSYNKMFGNERERLDLQDWRAEVEDFKMNMIYPAIVKRDLVEAVNYHWLQGVTKERFLFHTWGDAPAVRKLKRPRPRMSSAEGADSEVHGNV